MYRIKCFILNFCLSCTTLYCTSPFRTLYNTITFSLFPLPHTYPSIHSPTPPYTAYHTFLYRKNRQLYMTVHVHTAYMLHSNAYRDYFVTDLVVFYLFFSSEISFFRITTEVSNLIKFLARFTCYRVYKICFIQLSTFFSRAIFLFLLEQLINYNILTNFQFSFI
jgi:hypothetical protein